MTVTPDQAGDLLPGITPGPWEIHPDHGTVEPDVIGGEGCRFDASDTDLDLIAAAPELAQTVAGMEWQWSVERLTEYGSRWLIDRPWTCDRELAETWLRKYDGSRLVRRLVGPVEEAE